MKKFCDIARRVIAELPEEFHTWLDNVVVDVETLPRSEQGLESDERTLGLFEGVAVTEQSYGEQQPNRIVLYKQTIESSCRSEAEIAYEIRRTLIHELAHHFGYSEEDLGEFESLPSPFDEDSNH